VQVVQQQHHRLAGVQHGCGHVLPEPERVGAVGRDVRGEQGGGVEAAQRLPPRPAAGCAGEAAAPPDLCAAADVSGEVGDAYACWIVVPFVFGVRRRLIRRRSAR
jgi:hypothetical protein